MVRGVKNPQTVFQINDELFAKNKFGTLKKMQINDDPLVKILYLLKQCTKNQNPRNTSGKNH